MKKPQNVGEVQVQERPGLPAHPLRRLPHLRPRPQEGDHPAEEVRQGDRLRPGGDEQPDAARVPRRRGAHQQEHHPHRAEGPPWRGQEKGRIKYNLESTWCSGT